MESNNGSSQSYWFLLRDDQNNEQRIQEYSLQHAQISPLDTSYVVESAGLPQYIQVLEPQQSENTAKVLTNTSQSQSKHETHKLNKDIQEWTKEKIKRLLDMTPTDKYGNYLKERDIWKIISESIGIEEQACAKKYRNLRNIYIRLAKKRKMGKKIKWQHYKLCDKHFKNCNTIPDLNHKWDEQKITELLSLYLDKLPKLKNSEIYSSEVWKYIARTLDTSEYNCYTKFQHIKRSYYRYLKRNKHREKSTKWPFYNYCEKIFSTYSRSNWTEFKIKLLIESYSQYASKFKDRSYVKKDLWNTISKIVGESSFNCDRKFRNLKQTYNKLKSQTNSGKNTKWIFYKDFDDLSSITNFIMPNTMVNERSVEKRSSKTHKLLNFVVKNKEKFQNTLHKKKVLWKEISKELGMCPEECYSKFRNLKQTYVRIAQKNKNTRKSTDWPYYSYFECIYGQNEFDHLKTSTINRNVQEKVSIWNKKDEKFDKIIQKLKETNEIEKERNIILKGLIESDNCR